MTSSNKGIAGLLVLLLVGWGVFQLVLSEEGRASSSEASSAGSEEPRQAITSPPLAEPASVDRQAVGSSSAIEQALPATATEPATAAHGDGVLAVQVEDPEHRPLEGIRLQIVLDGEKGGRDLPFTELHQGDYHVSLVTNLLGRATCFVPASRSGVLHSWAEGSSGIEPSAVAFDPLDPFEERSLLVVLRRGSDASLERTVVDGSTGKPIAGALVRVQEQTRTIGGTRTDEDGVFRARWDSWREVHLRLDAEGYAPALVSLEPDAAPQPVPLWRTASLELSATTATGIPLGRTGVKIYGKLAEAMPPELRTPALLTEEIADSEIERRLSRLDPDGRKRFTSVLDGSITTSTDARGLAAFQELPPFVPLTIDLTWLAGNEAGNAKIRIAPLQPGETRAVSWSLPAKGPLLSLRGRLVDEDGASVVGHDVWLVTNDDDQGERYLRCGEKDYEARTEADGSFVICGHAARYLLGPAPECSAAFATANPNAVAPWASVVELVEGMESPEVLLRRPRGLYLVCEVVGPQGMALGAVVMAEAGGGSVIEVFVGKPLPLGPLLDTEHRVSAIARDARSAARSARPVRGGSEPLRLVLELPESEEAPTGSLSGVVIDAESGEALVVDVHAIAAELAGQELARRSIGPLAPPPWKHAASNGLGRFTLEHLEPGPYVLLAKHEDSLGLARAVVPGPGDRVRDVLLRVPSPGYVVVTDAEGTMTGEYFVLLEGLTVERAYWYQDMPFAVPSGAVTLMFTGVEQTCFREIDAPPGGTVAIDLTEDAE